MHEQSHCKRFVLSPLQGHVICWLETKCTMSQMPQQRHDNVIWKLSMYAACKVPRYGKVYGFTSWKSHFEPSCLLQPFSCLWLLLLSCCQKFKDTYVLRGNAFLTLLCIENCLEWTTPGSTLTSTRTYRWKWVERTVLAISTVYVTENTSSLLLSAFCRRRFYVFWLMLYSLFGQLINQSVSDIC